MNYILFGVEDYLIKERIKRLISAFNNKSSDIDIVKIDYLENGIEPFLDEISQLTFFTESKKVVIIYNAIYLSDEKTRKKIANQENKLLTLLENDDNNILTIQVVYSDTLLKRSEIVKNIEKIGKIYYFPQIKNSDRLLYIKKYFNDHGFKIEEKAIVAMNDKLKGDLYSFHNEADKLMLFKKDKIITFNDIELLVSKNLNDNVFDLTNAILAQDKRKVFELYNDLLLNGVEPITLISILAKNFIFYDEILFLAKNNNSANDIASNLNANPFRVQISLRNLKNMNINKVRAVLNELFELDKKIKNSDIDGKIGLELFLINIS